MLNELSLRWKYRGNNNRHLRELMRIPLSKGDVVIDCGANVGEITSILARKGSKVYAFEPNSYAFKELKRRFATSTNVECIQAGIHTENGTMRLYLHEMAQENQVLWSTGSSILSFKSNVSTDNYVEIEVIDFSEFISSLNRRIKLVKMDVEGAECEILIKMINTGLIQKIDHMFIERHDHKIPELKPTMEKIEQMLLDRNLTNVHLDWI
jgi:FkbM family methyltransferase